MDASLRQALERAENKLAIERNHLAAAVVRCITSDDDLIEDYEESVAAGFEAAIEESDGANLSGLSRLITEAASAEVKAQAKLLVLRLIRDLAARSGQEMVLPF
jgi:hypothetical protein